MDFSQSSEGTEIIGRNKTVKYLLEEHKTSSYKKKHVGREKEKVHELQNVCVVVMTVVKECLVVNFQNAKIKSPEPWSKLSCNCKHGNVIKIVKLENNNNTAQKYTIKTHRAQFKKSVPSFQKVYNFLSTMAYTNENHN